MIQKNTAKYFFRLHVQDEVGVFADITTVFAKYGVSFRKNITASS